VLLLPSRIVEWSRCQCLLLPRRLPSCCSTPVPTSRPHPSLPLPALYSSPAPQEHLLASSAHSRILLIPTSQPRQPRRSLHQSRLSRRDDNVEGAREGEEREGGCRGAAAGYLKVVATRWGQAAGSRSERRCGKKPTSPPPPPSPGLLVPLLYFYHQRQQTPDSDRSLDHLQDSPQSLIFFPTSYTFSSASSARPDCFRSVLRSLQLSTSKHHRRQRSVRYRNEAMVREDSRHDVAFLPFLFPLEGFVRHSTLSEINVTDQPLSPVRTG
jgi:hypothetical protein